MSYILLDRADRVATVTINDPDKRNAINNEMNAELLEVFDNLEADDGVGAIVVTGAPPAFCAGADLDDLLAGGEAGTMRDIYSGFLRVAHTPLPTVAAVNGAAVGAGMNIVLACDLVVAGRSARFDSRFLQIGLHPGGGHTWRLRRVTDHQTTMAMVVFGQVLSGDEAAERGLAWDAVDDDQLLARAHELAGRAASFPRELVARTKGSILRLAEITGSEAAVDHELEPQLWSMHEPEFQNLVTELRTRISGKD